MGGRLLQLQLAGRPWHPRRVSQGSARVGPGFERERGHIEPRLHLPARETFHFERFRTSSLRGQVLWPLHGRHFCDPGRFGAPAGLHTDVELRHSRAKL